MWLSKARHLVLLSSLLLAACGWQLQGSRHLPQGLSPVYLDLTDNQSVLARQLRVALRDAGIAVAAERTQAASVLRLDLDETGHTVTSVSALNEPQQYEVFYRAEYVFMSVADGRILIPVQSASASRTMSYDKALALAKLREERALSENLARDLAQQMLRRITGFSGATRL